MFGHLFADPFVERRKALEEAFFKEKDRQLLEKLRSELTTLEERKKLAHVSGIAEQRILDHLVKAGVKAETLTAVVLIPFVEVAWADGCVSAEERDAVLNAAAAEGIRPDSASYELLKFWLDRQPDPNVIAAWKDYVHEVASSMPRDAVAKFKRSMIERASRVAESAGGFLGLAAVSKAENKKIHELSKAYDA